MQVLKGILGILLDAKLPFEEHYKTLLNKTNRTIGPLRKLQSFTTKSSINNYL